MKKSIYILFLVLLFSSLQAKPPYLRFKNVGVKQGLIYNDVQVVVEDKNQMLWVGTTQGLARFDGNEFISFNAADSIVKMLEKAFVMDLKTDADGNVWIATFNKGLFMYNLETGIFDTYRHDPSDSLSIPTNEISQIAFDKSGNTWVSTTKGLYLIKKDRQCQLFQHEEGNPQTLAGNYLLRVYVDRKESIWISGHNGLNKMTPVGDGSYHMKLYSKDSEVGRIPVNSVWSIAEGLDGKIWMGFVSGVVGFFDPEEETFTAYDEYFDPKGGFIYSILPDNRGNLWIGDMDRGLMKFNIASTKVEKIWRDNATLSTLPSDAVKSVYKSPTGKWIVTHSAGFSFFNPEKKQFAWEAVENPEKNGKYSWLYSTSFCEAGPNKLWVGSVKGIHLWDMKTDKWEMKIDPIADLGLPNDRNFKELFQDSKGRLWVDTRLGGPIYWDTKKKEAKRFSYPAMGIVQDYLEDDEGTIWITVDGRGLSCLREGADTLEFFHWPEFENATPKERFLRFIQAEDGTFWIGSYGQGLHQFDPKTEKYLQKIPYIEDKKDGLPGQVINDLCSDGKGGIWLACSGGLSHFDPKTKRFQNYDVKDGLPSNKISSVEIDLKGNLWIGSQLGLTKYDPEKQQFRSFTQMDGLSDKNYFHGQAERVGEKMIYLGPFGLTLFNPDLILPPAPLPKVILTNFKVLNKTAPLERSPEATTYIELGPKDYAFTFEYASPGGMYSAEHQYACKLEGLGDEWILMEKSKSATYTALSPGKYTFYAKIWDPTNTESAEPLQIELYVRPAFWQTTLFKAFLILLGAGILLFMIWLGKRQLEIRHEKELAEQSAAYKSQFLANMSHEIRTPMHAVLSAAELLGQSPLDEKQERYLQHIRRAGNNLLNLINDILDFSKIEAGKLNFKSEVFSLQEVLGYVQKSLEKPAFERENELTFSVPKHLPDKLIGDSVRLGQILLNLLSNAIKFTEKGKVELIAGIQEEEKERIVLTFQVKDTGVGIREEKLDRIFDSFVQGDNQQNLSLAGVGLGLAITKQLVEQQGGRISVKSVSGEGTVFSFYLPFQKAVAEKPAPIIAQATATEDIDAAQVLLVEDIALNRELALDMISKAFPNVTVTLAESGKKALEVLEKGKLPDLILMDVRMPEMDGLTCTQHIRDRYGAIVPIIALTASATEEEMKRCLLHGMDGFLAKPFTPDQLTQSIHDVLSPLPAENQLSVDMEKLSHFLGHDEDRIQRYLTASRDEIFRHYRSLRIAISNEDWESAQIASHSLKTTFRYLGINPLADQFAQAESAFRKENESQVLAALPDIARAVRGYWKSRESESLSVS